jgi:MFS transporter, FSR family, fosmidomycin resistance protein
VREAAWPALRTDLGLTYAQVGLLIALPGVLGALVEPVVGVLADGRPRRPLLLGGGAAYAAALLLAAGAWGMPSLLVAMIVLYPASGAFVGLSEAALIDLDPGRHERRMLAWSLAGSLGATAGPLLLALAGAVAAGGAWRAAFAVTAVVTVAVVAGARRVPVHGDAPPHPAPRARDHDGPAWPELGLGMARQVRAALRAPGVARWLAVLQLTDLLGDVLLGYLALYLLDVGQVRQAEAVLAVSVWTGALMAGEALLLGPLRRVPGRRWLRATALAATLTYPAFLLVTGHGTGGSQAGGIAGTALRLGLVALLGLAHAGWYALPKSWLFAALPGRGGTVLALESLASVVGSLAPLGLGLLATEIGLDRALWALLLAPIAVLVLVPRHRSAGTEPKKPTHLS